MFVNLSVNGEKEHAKFSATSINISTAGLSNRDPKVLNIEDIVNCSFFLPGASAISVTGEIVRTIKKPTEDACQYGIKFTTISDVSIQLIEDFVKSHSSLGQ